jgi:hypothetical protein
LKETSSDEERCDWVDLAHAHFPCKSDPSIRATGYAREFG